MIYSIEVFVTVPVLETEVRERVVDAVLNVFPGAEVSESGDGIEAEVRSLEHFSEQLHRQEILDTARSEFFGGLRGDSFSFALKKQAAFKDVVNFAVGNPDELGDIQVRVRVDEPDVESFIDHIAPPTEEGRPVTDES